MQGRRCELAHTSGFYVLHPASSLLHVLVHSRVVPAGLPSGRTGVPPLFCLRVILLELLCSRVSWPQRPTLLSGALLTTSAEIAVLQGRGCELAHTSGSAAFCSLHHGLLAQ